MTFTWEHFPDYGKAFLVFRVKRILQEVKAQLAGCERRLSDLERLTKELAGMPGCQLDLWPEHAAQADRLHRLQQALASGPLPDLIPQAHDRGVRRRARQVGRFLLSP